MKDRLRKIATYLQAGIVHRELIGETIRYSIEKSKESPGGHNPESLTASYYINKQRPKLHLICATISRQLGAAMAGKLQVDGIKKAGDEMALQVDLWIEETQQQTKQELTEDQDDSLYRKAVEMWNQDPNTSWPNIAETLTNNRVASKTFMQNVKRFATKNNIEMRLGSPGTKRRQNRNE